ncbi:MAG: TolC family protein [Bacteroidota bacterium]
MRKAVSFGVIWLVATAMLSAQVQPGSQKVLALKEAVQIALDKNFTVKQAQNNLESAQTAVVAAYGNFLPTLNLNGSWNWSSGQSFLPNGTALPTSNQRSINSSINSSITLFDGFSNTSTLSRAVSTSVATEYTLDRTRQNLINKIQTDYYEVLRTERLVKVAEETVKYDEKQLDKVKETARLGSASIVNVYQQQAQFGSDDAALVQARNTYDIAKANLLADISVEVSEDYVIQDSSIPEEVDRPEFEVLQNLARDFQGLAREALDNRLDFLSAREQYNAAEADVTASRSGYFPSITAGLSYGLTGSYNSINKPDVNEFSDINNARSFGWSVRFSLPLFSGFQTNNSVQRSLVAKKNAEEGLRDTERRIQVEVKNNLLLMQASLKSYESAVNNLQLQDQNLKINQEKYNIGSGTLLDLLLAQNNYNNALSNKINSVYQYLKAKSLLELSLGRTKE